MRKLCSIFITLAALVILLQSCDNCPECPPNSNNEKKDSLLINKSNQPDSEGLQNIYLAPNGFNYYLFGRRDTQGLINKISSMSIIRQDRSDSVLNVLFDDNLRVSAFYFTLNGVPDNAIISMTYPDDSIYVTSYKINWNTGERSMEARVHLNKTAGIGQTEIFGRKQSLWDDVQAITASIAGIVVAVPMTVVVTTALGAKLCKLPCAVVGFVAGLALVLSPDHAKAIELEGTPIGSPLNPASLFSKLKSPADLLMLHPWIEVLGYTDTGNPVQYLGCDLDDYYTFLPNNVYSWSEGPNVCPEQTEPFLYGSYSLSSDFQTLVFEGHPTTVVEITFTSLKLRSSGYPWNFVAK